MKISKIINIIGESIFWTSFTISVILMLISNVITPDVWFSAIRVVLVGVEVLGIALNISSLVFWLKENKNNVYLTEVKLDGQKLECVRSIDYSIVAGSLPTARIEFGMPSITARADIKLEHPEIILKHCTTKQLVDELRKRESVEVVNVKPHSEVDLGTFVGPAIILKVVDGD